MKLYFDFRDWWVGYYRGDTHHYVCVLPTLVLRWDRKVPVSSVPHIELDHKLGQPTQCKVWVNDKLIFAGQDYSATLERQ